MRPEQWGPLQRQFAHPLKPRGYEPKSHQAKLAFRLTVPVVVHLTGTGVPGAVGIQILSALGLLYLTASLAFEASRDRVVSALITLAAASNYAGFSGFWDARGVFDCLAIGLLLGAMRARPPWLVALLVFLAAFTDERAIPAVAFTYLWFVGRSLPSGETSPNLRWFPRQTWGILAGCAAYLGTRFLLGALYGLETPIGNEADVGLAVLIRQLEVLPVGLWTALESLWLPVLAALYLLLTSRLRVFGLAVLGALGLVLGVANCALDVTRGAIYAFPVVFVAVNVVAAWEPRDTLRSLGLWSVLLGVIGPSIYLQGINISVCSAAPVRAIQQLLSMYLGW